MPWSLHEKGKRPRKLKGVSRRRPQHSMNTALDGANPSRDSENCVLSCHAWLMRKQGYDVSAPPGFYDPPGVVGSTAIYSSRYWRDEKGKPPSWSDQGSSTPDSVMTALSRRPVGSFGLLRYSGFPSHVMGWEKLDSGVRLVDPQSGTFSEADFWFGDHGSFQWVDMTRCRPLESIATLFKEVP